MNSSEYRKYRCFLSFVNPSELDNWTVSGVRNPYKGTDSGCAVKIGKEIIFSAVAVMLVMMMVI